MTEPDWQKAIRERLQAATPFHHIGHVSEINPEAVDFMAEDGQFIGEIRGRNNEAFYSNAQKDIAHLLEAIRVKDAKLQIIHDIALYRLQTTDDPQKYDYDILEYSKSGIAFDPTAEKGDK